MWNRILNPFIVFSITWIFVMYLISLKLTNNINSFNVKGVLIIVINIFSSLFIFIFFKLLYSKRKSVKNYKPTEPAIQVTYNLANKCFLLFLILVYSDFYSCIAT